MQISAELRIGDIINLMSLVFMVVGGVFTYFKWQKEQRAKRSERLSCLIQRLRKDSEECDFLWTIDYDDKVWYDRGFHGKGDKKECMVDEILACFSYVCYLRKCELLKDDEMQFFGYELSNIINNDQVCNYLYNLYHYNKKYYPGMIVYTPFEHLIDYGIKNGCFGDDFRTNENRYQGKRYLEELFSANH